MASMEQRIVVGTTQTLVGYPRLAGGGGLRQGVPSSVTCKVWTPSSSPTAFVAATADTFSETVTASAPAGATELAITSGDVVQGRQYLVEDEGHVQVVETRDGGSAQTVLRLAQPLARAVGLGATVLGWAVTKALTAEQTAQPGGGSVLWSAIVDGVVVQWSENFRVVNRLPRMTLTPSGLTRAYASLLSATPPTDPNLEHAILGAWETEVVPLLESKWAMAEDVTSPEALEALHMAAVMMVLYCYDPRIDDVFKDRLDKKWRERITTTFARITYAERAQDQEPSPLSPGDEPKRNRTRLRT